MAINLRGNFPASFLSHPYMRRLLLIPLAGASLTLLALLWPADDPAEAPGEDDLEPAAVTHVGGRLVELNRLIHQQPGAARLPAQVLAADYHGVVKDSVTGAVLEGPEVKWAAAVKGKCEEERVDWQDAEVADDGTFTITRQEAEEAAVLCLELESEGHVSRTVVTATTAWPTGRPGLLLRLDPHAKIRGRVLDARGKPLENTDIYRVFGDSQEAEQDERSKKNGWYELSELKPGRYLVYTETDHTYLANFAEVQLRAGEVRRLDLRERKVSSLIQRGRVVDRGGHPLARVAVKIDPRDGARSAMERYFLSRTADTATWRGGTFEAELGRAGWYRVRLYAGPDAKKVMGQAHVYVGTGHQEQTTVVFQGKITACSLHDSSGSQVGLTGGYSMTISRGCTSLGMGILGGMGGRSRYQDLRFPWPEGARSVTVTLNGNGVSGSLRLDGPNDPCRIQGKRRQ